MPATQTEGMGWGGGVGCHVDFKQTWKGAEWFRANVAKPANLAEVWGRGKHGWADVPFVGFNELAGQNEEAEKWLPGLTFSGLVYLRKPVPVPQTQFIWFIEA